MGKNTILSKLEALLFIYGEPIEVKKLAKIIGEKEADVRAGLVELETGLAHDERGIMLVQDKDNVQLVTKPEFSKLLEEITKQEFTEALTPAALETLSIIAYAGPITRADIEYIRGVNSSFTIRALLMRGLIERETDPKRANAYMYSTSFELLRHLGLSKNDDLPEYKKYKDLVSMLHKTLEQKDQIVQPQEVLPPANAEDPTNANVQSNSPESQP